MTLDTPPGIRALEGEHQLAPYKICATGYVELARLEASNTQPSDP